MKPFDLAQAVAIIPALGATVCALRIGPEVIPTFMLCTIWVFLLALAMICFVLGPNIPLGRLPAVAVMLGMFRFALWFAGMDLVPSSWIASLVLQPQVASTEAPADGLPSVGAAFQLAHVAILFGFGGWVMRIANHGTGRSAAFSLCAPLFTMASAALLFGGTVKTPQLLAAGLIIAGLALNLRQRLLFQTHHHRKPRICPIANLKRNGERYEKAQCTKVARLSELVETRKRYRMSKLATRSLIAPGPEADERTRTRRPPL